MDVSSLTADPTLCTTDPGEYDLGLHVTALFVLLVASGIGVFLPVILGARGRHSNTLIWTHCILQHFGSGIIISTAFIHLLSHAFTMFADPCLGNLVYDPAPGAIAMGAFMVVFAIYFLAARRMYQASCAAEGKDSEKAKTEENGAGQNAERPVSFGHDHDFSQLQLEASRAGGFGKDRKARWEVEMLEAGIIFHSIMIGVTLGAQGGPTFIPVFIAIIFHQLFEGLGLGVRIARVQYPSERRWQKWLMCLAFTIVTSSGIAIGIGARNSFNESSRTTLLAIGILDSISSGILLYASVAQLLVAEWLAGDMKRASGKKLAVGALSLIGGLVAMSVIGHWA